MPVIVLSTTVTARFGLGAPLRRLHVISNIPRVYVHSGTHPVAQHGDSIKWQHTYGESRDTVRQ